MAINLSLSSTINEALAPIQSSSLHRSHEFKNHLLSFPDSNYSFLHASANSKISSSSICIGNLATGPDKRMSGRFSVRVSAQFPGESSIAPVRLKTSAGKKLLELLEKQTARFPSAFYEQLILVDSNLKNSLRPPSKSEIDRKESAAHEMEWWNLMEEMMYCKIVDKFHDNCISMIPPISPTKVYTRRVDYWPNQQEKFTLIPKYPEVVEMIQSHLIHSVGVRKAEELTMLPVLELTRKGLGIWYAKSIAFGYHLQKIDIRYRLENSLNPFGEDYGVDLSRSQVQQKVVKVPDPLLQMPEDSEEAALRGANKMRAYLFLMDDVHRRRLETIRTSQARSLINMQTQAVFARPDFQDYEFQLPVDETIELSESGITCLILEAIAFGIFLFDTEDFFHYKCHPIFEKEDLRS